MTYNFKECRKRLTIVWLGGGSVLLLVMIAQTFGGALSDKPTEAWSWFLPNVMPTSMLVASSLVGDAQPQKRSSTVQPDIDQFYYRLAMAVSAFYLALILIVLLGWRATASEDPIQLMSIASLWIAPIQGLTASIISIFFNKRSTGRRKASASRSRKAPD